MKNGFYTALGTPVDEFGNLCTASLKKHVRDQVEAGASGLLVMGSMGMQPCIKESEYPKVAAAAAEAAKGECPVFVGVMDNSAVRVGERINALRELKIEGVVATTPFYFTPTQAEIKNFFINIARTSYYPLYLYDLPGVTKVKIGVDTAEQLMAEENIKGIKTGDIVTARVLNRSEKRQIDVGKSDFSIMFSGLDVFDVAYKSGIRMNLDGMFSCTAVTAAQMYQSMENGDDENSSKCLDQILALRNLFVEIGVFRGFTFAMNLLGYEGNFAPDYTDVGDKSSKERVREFMKQHHML